MSDYPRSCPVRQQFERPRIADVELETRRQLSRLPLAARIQPGETIAITAGSRGIANLGLILRALGQYFRGLGGQPFIVPAMGSHGGGTAEGQLKVLQELGITEEFCGCEIRASMETVVVCQAAEGFPVHFDRQASQADHVVVCGRVKPHTGFVGDIESGLMKMMLIGLGKHEAGPPAIVDFSRRSCSVAHEVLARCHSGWRGNR